MPQSIKAQRALKDALKALATIEGAGYEARLAGGCVRDRLLGILPKDYDIAATSRPDETCAIFEQKGYKVVPTGVEHGTVTVVTPTGPIEVTTLREDVATHGRHATVVFGHDFQKDAARRDFTINAMFEDRHGKIYDYFLGKKDLQEGVLRFVGKSEERIQEDYLRIMRFFRFWARYDLKPDQKAIEAFAILSDGLASISQERKISELIGLLETDHPDDAVKVMWETGVLGHAVYEYGVKPPPLIAIKLTAEKLALTRLAQILNLEKVVAEMSQVKTKLKLAVNQLKFIRSLHLTDHDVAQLLTKKTTADILEFIDARESGLSKGVFLEAILPIWQTLRPRDSELWLEMEKTEKSFGYRRHTSLPLSGNEVARHLGLQPGPQIGQVLEKIRRAFWQGEVGSKKEAEAFLETIEKKDPSDRT